MHFGWKNKEGVMTTITQKIHEYDAAMDQWISATPLRRFIHWFVFWPLIIILLLWSISIWQAIYQGREHLERIAKIEASAKGLREIAGVVRKYAKQNILPTNTVSIPIPGGLHEGTERGTIFRACYSGFHINRLRLKILRHG
jgi:hypothetical protein